MKLQKQVHEKCDSKSKVRASFKEIIIQVSGRREVEFPLSNFVSWEDDNRIYLYSEYVESRAEMEHQPPQRGLITSLSLVFSLRFRLKRLTILKIC